MHVTRRPHSCGTRTREGARRRQEVLSNKTTTAPPQPAAHLRDPNPGRVKASPGGPLEQDHDGEASSSGPASVTFVVDGPPHCPRSSNGKPALAVAAAHTPT